MALKSPYLLLIAALAVGGCRGDTPQAATEEPEATSVTRWTDRTELFAEYAPLVVETPSRFAIHLTRLDTFKPLTEGVVEVRLVPGRGAAPETFRVEGPSRPGVFGVDVRPARAGKYQLVIALTSGSLVDEHRAGEVEVHADEHAAEQAGTGEAEPAVQAISFLKEQQWTLDFGTAVVHERALRESLQVPAEVVARPGGSAEVVAPVDGRLTAVAALLVGAPVRQGQELARILPPPGDAADLPAIEQARGEAQARLELARQDRARAERLVAIGAAPQKRVDEARAAENIAETQVRAAEARLRQHAAARTAQGAPQTAQFILRAPVSGTVAALDATAGSNVTAGSVLFRLVDANQVHIIGRVPEAEAARAAIVSGAEVEVPGRETSLSAGRPISRGRLIDPESRTIPIVFGLDNRTGTLSVGQAVSVRLLFEQTGRRAVVPVTAIVDDAGRPVVFVQREGETFERRPVTLGAREGDLVQVVEGVKPGERVVTKGAYLIRLASLSTQIPAHGHVH